MRVVSTHVDDGRLVIIVAKLDGMTLYELAAAEIAIEAARSDALRTSSPTR